MRHLNKIVVAAVVALTGLSACQNDFDAPGLVTPQATLKPNISIAQLKETYDDNAYVTKVGVNEAGEHLVIAGRVISSDAAGNVYKNLVIRDCSGIDEGDYQAALTISLNANSLYNQYRVGQEIVIDVTDMYIGKYRGLEQICFPSETDQGTLEGTFCPLEFFKEHVELNGLPEPSQVEPYVTTHNEYASASPSVVRKYQSQLVEFKGCHFKEGGKLAFTDGSKITSNRTLVLAGGDTINVRTSGYSNFWAMTLPEGEGDVVGILSYFNSGNTADPWQLVLRSADDLHFGEKEPEQGSLDNPYTVDGVIELENKGEGGSGWVTGYIVGAVVPGTSAVTSNSDIEWTADVSMPNTLVIAQTPEITEAVSCLVVELPQGSSLREKGNLLDNPKNYKKQIWLKGSFAKVLGTWGITGNTGSSDEWKIDGVDNNPGDNPDTPDNPDKPSTGGTEASPYTVAQALALNNSGSGWVAGYIVGWADGNIASAQFNASAMTASNVLIADSASETDASKCIVVALPKGAIRNALNLMDNPSNLGKKVQITGTFAAYLGGHGLTAPTAYKWQ